MIMLIQVLNYKISKIWKLIEFKKEDSELILKQRQQIYNDNQFLSLQKI